MQLRSNHISLTSAAEINEIITPLKQYGINYFNYVKSNTLGSRIWLTTNAKLLEAWFDNKYYVKCNLSAYPKLYTDQFSFFTTLPNQDVYQWALKHFGVAHGIYLIQTHNEYTEFFSFASSQDNSDIINFYINNLDYMRKFCQYF